MEDKGVVYLKRGGKFFSMTEEKERVYALSGGGERMQFDVRREK